MVLRLMAVLLRYTVFFRGVEEQFVSAGANMLVEYIVLQLAIALLSLYYV